MIYFNLINYLVLFTFIIYFFRDLKFRYILTLSSMSPLIIFYIFPASYWPDQMQFLEYIIKIRQFDFTFNEWAIFKPSFILSLVPIPFIINSLSISLINKLLFFVIILFLYRKKLISDRYFLLIIFLPSSLLISTLALKDMVVFFLMFFSMYYFLKKYYFLSFIPLILIYFIKFQNSFFMLVFYFNYIFFFLRISFIYKLLCVFFIFIIFYFNSNIIIDYLNMYNKGFFFSSFSNLPTSGELRNDYYYDNIRIKNLYDFLYKFILRSFAFFIAPGIPYKLIHYLQIVENIIVYFCFLFIIFFAIKNSKIYLIFFWLLSLFIIFGLYGLSVYNYGTIVRYRYPFVLLFLLFGYIQIFDRNKL